MLQGKSGAVTLRCLLLQEAWETPEQCRASSTSSGSSMGLPEPCSPHSMTQVRIPACYT